jgi:hypothetical protein
MTRAAIAFREVRSAEAGARCNAGIIDTLGHTYNVFWNLRRLVNMEVSGQHALEIRQLKLLLWILFAAMIFSVGLYWFVLEMLAAQLPHRSPDSVKLALTFIAAVLAGAALYLRWASIAELFSPTGVIVPEPDVRLNQIWRNFILCYVLAESVALCGFVLRVLGESRRGVAPYFLGTVILLLVCNPRVPSELPDSSN